MLCYYLFKFYSNKHIDKNFCSYFLRTFKYSDCIAQIFKSMWPENSNRLMRTKGQYIYFFNIFIGV